MNLDGVGQRQFVLALSFVVQGIKLYDWLSYQQCPTAFLLKWAFWETSLLIVLWKIKVPRLAFSFPVSLAFAFLLATFNVLLFFGIPYGVRQVRYRLIPLSTAVEMVGIESNSVDEIIGSKEHLIEGIKNNSHLVGSYTVKIRPWSTALLNPDGRALCVPISTPMPNSQHLPAAIRRPIKSSKSSIKVPLLLTGAAPWTVYFSRHGSPKPDVVIVKGDGTTKFLAEIYVEEVGALKIEKIVDGNGSTGRIDGSDSLSIDNCPQARLDGLTIDKGIDMCNSRTFPLKLWFAGSAPFSLSYEIVTESSAEKGTITDIFPSSTKVGLFQLWTFELSGRRATSQFLFRITDVKDSSDCIHHYGSWDNGDAVVVNLFNPPTLKWEGDSRRPLKLLEGQKAVELRVLTTGRDPLSFEIVRPDNTKYSALEIPSGTHGFTASLPGLYKLLSVKDSLCSGTIDTASELSVQLVRKPSVGVTSEIIKSPCKGDLGISFEFMFDGEEPWTVLAQQRDTKRGGDKTTFTIEASSPRFKYLWKPHAPGNYDLELLSLSDNNYSKIPLKDLRYKAEVSPTPDALFLESRKVFSCLGSGVSLPVRVTGEGPWVLEYSVGSPTGKRELLKLDVSHARIDIYIDNIMVPGRYLVSLISIADSNGCVSNLQSQVCELSIFAKPPSAGFILPKDGIVRVREGTTDNVPIKSSANVHPLELKLRHESSVDSEYHILESGSVGIPLFKSGKWFIEGIKDKYCQGDVFTESVNVLLIPRPTVQFEKNLEATTCRSPDSRQLVKVISSGTGTIKVTYSVQYALDESGILLASKERRLISGDETEFILSSTKDSAPGYYRYELISVSDTYFPDLPLPGSHFIQQILPDPAPRIFLKSPYTTFCFDPHLSKLGPFTLDFTGSEIRGSLPIKFTYELILGDVLQSSHTVEKETADFEIDGITKPGSWSIRIRKVQTALGCEWNAPVKQTLAIAIREQHALMVNAVERPSVVQSMGQKAHYCIGDVAKFELRGSGPWTVSYTLQNGEKILKKSDSSNTKNFNILLAEPGILVLNQVCNRVCCAESSLEGMKYSVHELPTAVISDGLQYVREGEVAEFSVAFKGTPPFSFSFQRIDDIDSKVLETMTVSDIHSNDHRVKVSESGTFRVVLVRDKYCQYPKHHP